ncbi:hypothetical protein XENOCAPTIV_005199 [Xenoophorus captivus]|uniref:Uncharacterized protein n=1 Tax=Xenoophorus captivus TaxID=1517983 RepID=A0ABV0Q858_9TELE
MAWNRAQLSHISSHRITPGLPHALETVTFLQVRTGLKQRTNAPLYFSRQSVQSERKSANMLFQLSPRCKNPDPPLSPLSPSLFVSLSLLLSLSLSISLPLQLRIGHAISSVAAVHNLDLPTKTFFFSN